MNVSIYGLKRNFIMVPMRKITEKRIFPHEDFFIADNRHYVNINREGGCLLSVF